MNKVEIERNYRYCAESLFAKCFDFENNLDNKSCQNKFNTRYLKSHPIRAIESNRRYI